MIKKSGYALLSVLLYGAFESFILGYRNFVIYIAVLVFIVSADIMIFHNGNGRNISRLEVNRIASKSVAKNSSSRVVLTFRNPTRRRIYFHYYDTLSSIFRGDGPFSGDISLGGGEVKQVEYTILPAAIGRYRIGPIIVYASDPLGICISSYILTHDTFVGVTPSSMTTSTVRSERLSNFMLTQGIHLSRSVGQGYNFYGIRQYEESDEFRYIAWNRFGSLTGEDIYIKQMEEERTLDVVFAIDYSNGVNQGYGSIRMFDDLVSQVINAMYVVLRNHDAVGYIISSSLHDSYHSPEKTDKVVKAFGEEVSGIRPAGSFSIEDLLDKVGKNVKKEALVFILTPFAYPEKFISERVKLFPVVGKDINVFIINRFSYVKRASNEADRLLLRSAVAAEMKNLKSVSVFLNRLGLRTRIVEREAILVRLIREYQYRRVVA